MALRSARRRISPSDGLGTWSEADFQTRVIRLARDLHWGVSSQAWKAETIQLEQFGQPPAPLAGLVFHVRWSMGSDSGFPDLVLMRRRDGRVLFRELKTDKGKVSDRQAAVLELMTACGLDAAVWRPSQLDQIGKELL